MVNGNEDQGNSIDYLDLLNSWIPSKWFQISRKTGFHIQGRIRNPVYSGTRQAQLFPNTRRQLVVGRKRNSILACSNLAL